MSTLRNIISDQKQFWSAPLALGRFSARRDFLIFAGTTSALIAADRSITARVPESQLQRSRNLSTYATFSLAGGAAGLFALGQLSGDRQLRETGLLSGEAALNTSIAAYALQRATMRQRPDQGNGSGTFFARGSGFPSDHAAIAWSIASIAAHEYPGPLTKLVAYGLASTVTMTRLTGREHFASDVVVGTTLGWYLGRQVYRARHDSDLGGASWGSFDTEDGAEHAPRLPSRMGSPSVPLDSWVYAAIEKLAARGYVAGAFVGLKPWTRMECAQLVEQAGDTLFDDSATQDVRELLSRLQAEFSYELDLTNGLRERNLTATLDSLYVRAVSVSGPALTDSDHFGQTMAYDFGRPFRRGVNAQVGASMHAAAGPAAVYLRAEFQHAPGAPALTDAVRSFIASADMVPPRAPSAFSGINRIRLMDAYIALNVRKGWQFSLGQQSLSWGPGPGGSFLWSDNIEPIPMVRLTQSDTRLPVFLKFIGPVRIDSFFGRLDGHNYIPHPYIYSNKINFKPFPNLEIGFGRTVTIGGKGGDPLTSNNFFHSFLGQTNSQRDVPGDSHSSFDWTFYVPKLHRYVAFYGDLYADDDFLPFQNPPKNPFRPGIYLTRFPRLPKLDFHMEAVSTESPWYPKPWLLNYWNATYHDGYTNNGNLIGNTVGRMGQSIQCWFNYSISSRSTVQLTYKHNTMSPKFVPGGGSWQDYGFEQETRLHSGVYISSHLQYEHIASYPLLFHGPPNNVTAVIELGLVPHWSK